MKRRDLERHLRDRRHREIDFLLARKICRQLRVEDPTGPR
jgi:hypothetical protein